MSKLQEQPKVARVRVTIEMDDGTTREVTAEHPDDILPADIRAGLRAWLDEAEA